MAKRYVFYHDPCLDGYSAAFLMWFFEGMPSSEQIEFRGLSYSAKQNNYLNFEFDRYEKEKAHITFLDFVPGKEDLLEFSERGLNVCVIDHHDSAIKMLHELRDNTGVTPNSLVLAEENEMSGVGLVYNLYTGLLKDELHFIEDEIGEDGDIPERYETIHKMLYQAECYWDRFQHVQDRDLWHWALDGSREVCAAFDSYVDFKNTTFEQFKELLDKDASEEIDLKDEGKAILRFKQKHIDLIKTSWYPLSVGPYTAAALNSNVYQSELGNVLVTENPVDFAVIYYDDKHGQKRLSFRSRKDFDCSKVAVFFGGGGHMQACGATVNSLDVLKGYKE